MQLGILLWGVKRQRQTFVLMDNGNLKIIYKKILVQDIVTFNIYRHTHIHTYTHLHALKKNHKTLNKFIEVYL